MSECMISFKNIYIYLEVDKMAYFLHLKNFWYTSDLPEGRGLEGGSRG